MVLAMALVLALPVSCGPLNSSLGGDPCLLQQYRDRGFSIVGTIQNRLSALGKAVDALAPPLGAINAGQDISETLTALGEFKLQLGVEDNLLRTGAHPPEGGPFETDTLAAVGRFDTGVLLLDQAYVDTANGDTRTAAAIVVAARDWMQQGRLLLGKASVEIAALHAYSPNC